jgi:hypothetical protein
MPNWRQHAPNLQSHHFFHSEKGMVHKGSAFEFIYALSFFNLDLP